MKTGEMNILGDAFTVAWSNYSAVSTIVGWSSFTKKQLYTKKIGKMVFVAFQLEGTSNSTSSSFTIPYSPSSTINYWRAAQGYTQDNGVGKTTPGRITFISSGTTVSLFSDMVSAAWTNSGTKIINGQFFYESE